MLNPLRPILVGALLIAGHLGHPGAAIAQAFDLALVEQERAITEATVTEAVAHESTTPEAIEEPMHWRPDSVIGLAGDLDPASAPVKQSEIGDGSGWLVDVVPPVAPVYAELPVVKVAVVVPPPLVPPAGVKQALQGYQVEDNQHVRQFVDRFQTGYRRAVVEMWLERSGRYLPMILDVFRQKGLPDDLVFTAMIESGFNPGAVSRAGAKGLWQFMAPTARRYGLRIDEWMDERLDPEKSTMAAARHLIDLYAVFGSWNLVQAAYNAGEMRVLQAIRAMGTSDFWTLRSGPVLADETKNYIPAIQAATIIAKEPERYGFTVTPSEPLSYETVTVPKGTSLARLAARSGVPLEAIERLNLALRLKQTPPDGPYPLKVPAGTGKAIQSALERETSPARSAPASWFRGLAGPRGKAAPAMHVVKPKETVASIAKRYGVSVADLFKWNGLSASTPIRAGDRLQIAAGARRDEEGQGGFR